ncbi:MAG: type II secretion system protein [Proteobacteria bacterium]|nr:type II secretion system protein [Pseudomonadota bacterium]NOG60214.1 type II secretion system protein [Pseudomonadota bacterium]
MKLYNNKIRLNGFTLIELVIVILLLAILASYIAPRLDLSIFKQTGFEQLAMASIRYGQKQAIGSGCDVNVSINPASCTVQWNGTPAGIGCLAATTPITNPATGQANFCDPDDSTPNNSADLPTTIRFDNIGRPVAIAGDLNINLGSTIIIVEPETGFAHE